jgi:transposase-like protein
MDETYIKVKGVWRYLYRAVDKYGETIDFLHTPSNLVVAYLTSDVESTALLRCPVTT